MLIGIIIEIYSFTVPRSISSLKSEGKAGVILGFFIFVSGIWVLTDSKALSIFTTYYGTFGGNGVCDFTELLNIADKHMYADKKSRKKQAT